MQKFLLTVLLILFCGGIVSCVGPQPNDDYLFAWTAMEAAKKSQAPKYAAGLWGKAEEYYEQALIDYREREYTNATENFRRARTFAEKAENYTALKKAQTGAVD
jgi:hypothetical protein